MAKISQEVPKSIEPPWSHVPPTGPVLRPPEAAAYYGVSLSSYYEMIQTGELPQFVKLGSRARASGVPRVWLDAVIAARVAAALGAR